MELRDSSRTHRRKLPPGCPKVRPVGLVLHSGTCTRIVGCRVIRHAVSAKRRSSHSAFARVSSCRRSRTRRPVSTHTPRDVDEAPTTASVAQQFPSANRITPGHHDQSLVWLLSHRRGTYQTPPLVSHVVDDGGTQKLSYWIDALMP